MKQVLFLCSRNRLRSPSAEQLYADSPGIEVASAGLSRDAQHRVGAELLEWAEWIFVMEVQHQRKLNEKYGGYLKGKRITCLDVPDEYDFMQAELLYVLETKLTPFLGPPARRAADQDPPPTWGCACGDL